MAALSFTTFPASTTTLASSTSSSTSTHSYTTPTSRPLCSLTSGPDSIPNVASDVNYCYIGSSNATDSAMNICCGGTNLVSHIGGCDWCQLPEIYTNRSSLNQQDVRFAFQDCLAIYLSGTEVKEYGVGCVLPGVKSAAGRVGVRDAMVLGLVVAVVVGVL